jgi:hypothetical protein
MDHLALLIVVCHVNQHIFIIFFISNVISKEFGPMALGRVGGLAMPELVPVALGQVAEEVQ